MMTEPSDKPQLRMVWPPDKLGETIEPKTPPGYVIRTFQPGDEVPFFSLMAEADFDP